MNQKFAEDLMSKFSELLASSPAKDLERNARALFGSFFARMNLVTREEFDVQRELLNRTRERLEALEAKLAQLEQTRGA
ncbi:MAG: accessory factor UbiK family protein [Burkholderiales bacterium]